MIKIIIVLDTNIFISAVFWEGKPYSVVKKAINQEIIVFISNYIIEEIRKATTHFYDKERKEEDIVYFDKLQIMQSASQSPLHRFKSYILFAKIYGIALIVFLLD